MWSYGSEHFDKNRMKKYQKKHGAEVASCMSNLKRAVSMLDEGKTLEEIAGLAFEGIEFDPFDTIDVDYVCTCSRERMKRGIRSLGKEKVLELFDEEEKENGKRVLTAECRFCDKTYRFTEKDFRFNVGQTEKSKGENK